MSKQLLFDAFRHKEVDRAPWVPFAGVHAGKLLNYTAKEVLQDENKLLESLLEVNKLYVPDGQPVLFDLQVEAEIFGCELHWAEDVPPSVKTHPLADTKEIPCKCLIPSEDDGRLPMILNVMRQMKEKVGDTTALYGLVCGPFTLASHLRGSNIFMDMFDDPDYVLDLVNFCMEVNKAFAKYYVEAGMDVIAVVDPLVSQISSDHFNEFLSQSCTELFAYIKELGAFSSFFVCGDATRNIEVMCQTKPDNISVDENINLLEAYKITKDYNIVIGGNIPLTTIMLHGTQQDNMKYVIDLIDEVDTGKNLIISPGCDMPYDIPIENTIAVAQAVTNTERTREIIKNYEVTETDIHVELPDYTKLNKPFIEAFTLDSATCAACTYMMDAANRAKDTYKDQIDIIEYKFTLKENIARCKKMGVKHLPSMYINGELKFSSIIPSKEELNSIIDSLL